MMLLLLVMMIFFGLIELFCEHVAHSSRISSDDLVSVLLQDQISLGKLGTPSVAFEIDKFSFYFISSDTVLSKFHLQGVSVLSLIMEVNDPRTPHCWSWCCSSYGGS